MREKVRVLHCLETIGSGGVEQRRLTLAKKLNSDLYEQQIICTKAVGGLPASFEETNCVIHEVGEFRSIFYAKVYGRSLNIIKEFRPHIIHGAVFEGVAQAAVAGRLGKVPIIIGEETSDPQNRSWKGNLLYQAFAGLCHHMVGVSPATVNYLINDIKLPAGKVTLVNNGVVEKNIVGEEDIKELRKKIGLNEDCFIIGTVGRLFDDHKRVRNLIQAMVMIVAKRPDARLLIIGSGPDELKLRQLAKDLNLESYIIFAGYQADPQPFYQIMDVFALASNYEAFGLVLVEAMFNQLPIVATRVGGIPSVVNDGETGLLVEPRSPNAIANTILSLANDEPRRRLMGKKGRERALKHFSADRYVRDVDSLYQRLLTERKVI